MRRRGHLMSKLRISLVTAGISLGWLGCGDNVTYNNKCTDSMGHEITCKGEPGASGAAGPNGSMGAMGAMGAPGAPATTNDHYMFRPVGQLQGVVFDAYDKRPIAGAKITIAYNG